MTIDLKSRGIRAAQSSPLSDSNTKKLAENMHWYPTHTFETKKHLGIPWTWKPPRTLRGYRLGIRTIISSSSTSAETTQGHRTDEEIQLLTGSVVFPVASGYPGVSGYQVLFIWLFAGDLWCSGSTWTNVFAVEKILKKSSSSVPDRYLQANKQVEYQSLWDLVAIGKLYRISIKYGSFWPTDIHSK